MEIVTLDLRGWSDILSISRIVSSFCGVALSPNQTY